MSSFLNTMYQSKDMEDEVAKPIPDQTHGSMSMPALTSAVRRIDHQVAGMLKQIEDQRRDIKRLEAAIRHLTHAQRSSMGDIRDLKGELDTKVSTRDF